MIKLKYKDGTRAKLNAPLDSKRTDELIKKNTSLKFTKSQNVVGDFLSSFISMIIPILLMFGLIM